MPLKITKARDVTIKLVDDTAHFTVLDDEEINDRSDGRRFD